MIFYKRIWRHGLFQHARWGGYARGRTIRKLECWISIFRLMGSEKELRNGCLELAQNYLFSSSR